MLRRIISQTPNLIVEARLNEDIKVYWTLKNDSLIPYKFPNNLQNPHQIFQRTKKFITYSNNDTIYVSDKSGKKIFQFNDNYLLSIAKNSTGIQSLAFHNFTQTL